MRTIGYCLLAACLLALSFGIATTSATAVTLRRGINITNWFRFPPSRDPAALRVYLDDAAMEALRRAGFDFVRLPVQPELLDRSDVLREAVKRLERHGLRAVVALSPVELAPGILGSRQGAVGGELAVAGLAATAARSCDDVA